MILYEPFLLHVLDKYAVAGISLLIADVSARVIAATDRGIIGTRSQEAAFILQTGHSATIDHGKPPSSGQALVTDITHASLLAYDGETFGALVCTGPREEVMSLGAQVKSALETAAAYHGFSREMLDTADERALLARMLLDEHINEPRVTAMMNKTEMDPTLLRSAMVIGMRHHQPTYFNINLNLGYQSSVERTNESIVDKIRHSRFINTQDLALVHDHNTLVIIKSFLPGSDITRAYQSLDVICGSIAQLLSGYSGFSFHIAYGNLYPKLRDIRQSFLEATQMIELGRKTHPDESVYALDALMFDAICAHLQPQIVNKVVLPIIAALSEAGEELPGEVLRTANRFVDSCMSISRTAEGAFLHRNTVRLRMEKLKALTGLDPAESFRDAFVVKMIATYLKLNDIRQAPRE